MTMSMTYDVTTDYCVTMTTVTFAMTKTKTKTSD